MTRGKTNHQGNAFSANMTGSGSHIVVSLLRCRGSSHHECTCRERCIPFLVRWCRHNLNTMVESTPPGRKYCSSQANLATRLFNTPLTFVLLQIVGSGDVAEESTPNECGASLTERNSLFVRCRDWYVGRTIFMSHGKQSRRSLPKSLIKKSLQIIGPSS